MDDFLAINKSWMTSDDIYTFKMHVPLFKKLQDKRGTQYFRSIPFIAVERALHANGGGAELFALYDSKLWVKIDLNKALNIYDDIVEINDLLESTIHDYDDEDEVADYYRGQFYLESYYGIDNAYCDYIQRKREVKRYENENE